MRLTAFLCISLSCFAGFANIYTGEQPSGPTASGMNAQQPNILSTAQQASNYYIDSFYGSVAEPICQVLDALALTTSNKLIRKMLRAITLGSHAARAAAFGTSTLSLPGTNPRFKNSYLLRGLHATITWRSIKETMLAARLLTHDRAIKRKLGRLSPQELRNVQKARIKNAALELTIRFALAYAISKLTKEQDASIVYYHLLSIPLHRYLLDDSKSMPHLERSLLAELRRDKQNGAINIRDIMAEIKAKNKKRR